MTEITKKYFASTTVHEVPDGSIEKIMDFLSAPESVNRMIVATELGKPALCGVVEELEERFGYCDFPLHTREKGEPNVNHNNSGNRRTIGWMVRFVMREFGYSPIPLERQINRPVVSNSDYFSTSALYEKTGNENYILDVKILPLPFQS